MEIPVGTSPRTHGDARLQFWKNLDVVFAKDVQAFGRVTSQASFMRIWQLTFRYRF